MIDLEPYYKAMDLAVEAISEKADMKVFAYLFTSMSKERGVLLYNSEVDGPVSSISIKVGPLNRKQEEYKRFFETFLIN